MVRQPRPASIWRTGAGTSWRCLCTPASLGAHRPGRGWRRDAMTTTGREAPTFEDLTGYRPAHNGWSADGVFGSSGAHGQVQRDLARWLRAAGYLIFTEVQLPNQSTRADVDRKSTRLNSSHQLISYAVFCL